MTKHLAAQPALRLARLEDFDYCARLYFEGMGNLIKELNLDLDAHAAGFRRQWGVAQVRIITLDGTNIGWLQSFIKDYALFLAQLKPTTNEIERIIITNAATNTLSVLAQKSGELLINAGYSARTIRGLADLFANDFARRERTLIEEANRHKAALGLPTEPLPDIPPLPPAGGGTAAPRKLPSGWNIEIR